MSIQWCSDQTLLLQPPSGERLRLVKWTVHPFSGVNYRDYLKSGRITLILRDVYTDTGEFIDEIEMALTSLPDIKKETFALVKGGWMHIPYIVKDSHIISDRNFITELKSHFEGGNLKNPISTSAINCLLGEKCYHFDNVYFIFESNIKQIPDAATIHDQFIEGRRHILKAIPDAIFSYDEETELKNSLSLVRYCHEQMQLRIDFLLAVAPALAPPIAKAKRREVWDDICKNGDKIGLKRNDLMVLCALAAAGAGQSFNPGKGVIKPIPDYTVQDAYNAACDIQAIEILMNFQHNLPDKRHVLLTKDKNLMCFYSCICSYEMRNATNDRITADSEMIADLFVEINERKSYDNGDLDDLIYMQSLIKGEKNNEEQDTPNCAILIPKSQTDD